MFVALVGCTMRRSPIRDIERRAVSAEGEEDERLVAGEGEPVPAGDGVEAARAAAAGPA